MQCILFQLGFQKPGKCVNTEMKTVAAFCRPWRFFRIQPFGVIIKCHKDLVLFGGVLRQRKEKEMHIYICMLVMG